VPVLQQAEVQTPAATAAFAPTSVRLSDAERGEVQQRYEAWLRAVLGALLDAKPQGLMNSYLAGW
jgi:hypothetical protein